MEHTPTPRDIAPRQVESVTRRPTVREAFAQAERLDVNRWSYTLTPEAVRRSHICFDLWELPEYIGVKGGAARNLLTAAVDPAAVLLEPRDVDLVVLKDVVKNSGYEESRVDRNSARLARRFSPRDAQYGYGVDTIGHIQEHMEGADFTINQVLAYQDGESWHVEATAQAVIDTLQHVIRPTIREHNTKRGYLLGNKLALKAVRLLSEMQVAGVADVRIEGIDLSNEEELHGDPTDDYFMQALQMDKALERGYDVALQYLVNLEKLNMLPWDMQNSNDVESFYRELVQEADFTPSAGVPETLRKIKKLQKMGAVALGRPKNNQPGMFEDLHRRQAVVQHYTGIRP